MTIKKILTLGAFTLVFGLLTTFVMFSQSGIVSGANNYNSFTSATNSKVSVGSSDTVVLSANTARVYALIVNDSDETIYLSLSATAVINEGIRINANGGSYEINPENLYIGEVSAISASGSKNVTTVEK